MSREEYSELKGISMDDLKALDQQAVKLTKDVTILDEIPRRELPLWAVGSAPSAQVGEQLMFWQSKTCEDPETWENIPLWLGACLDREFVKYKQLANDATKDNANSRLSKLLDSVTESGIKIFHNKRFHGEAIQFMFCFKHIQPQMESELTRNLQYKPNNSV